MVPCCPAGASSDLLAPWLSHQAQRPLLAPGMPGPSCCVPWQGTKGPKCQLLLWLGIGWVSKALPMLGGSCVTILQPKPMFT